MMMSRGVEDKINFGLTRNLDTLRMGGFEE